MSYVLRVIIKNGLYRVRGLERSTSTCKVDVLTICNFPKEELFGLQSQMKRAVISIPSNIAEGCGRNHPKDSLQFFFISRGSIYELETQLYLALDLNYIRQETFDNIVSQIEVVRKLINGFIKYYESLLTKK